MSIINSTLFPPADNDFPIVCHDNLVTVNNILADSEDINFPGINIVNSSTYLRWQSLITSTQNMTVDLNNDINYLAIVNHNLGTIGSSVRIEQLQGINWSNITNDVNILTDDPIIFRFSTINVNGIRLRMSSNSDLPTIAVMYVGLETVMQRKIYVGHTPINYGRSTKIINGFSESGNFLGRVIINEKFSTNIDFNNITPQFFRTNIVPFLEQAVEFPFFFAWRPNAYPDEIVYAWLINDSIMSNQLPNGMIQFSFGMQGIVS